MTLSIVPRREIGERKWDAFVAAHPSGWLWHTWGWREYGLALGGDREDLSFAVLDGSQIVSLVPLMREGSRCAFEGEPDGGWFLTSGHLGEDGIYAHLPRMLKRHNVQVSYRSTPLVDDPLWLPGLGAEGIDFRSRVIDLRHSETELHAGVRKSYRHLINRGEKQCKIIVGAEDFAEEYALVHGESVGRIAPRPERTYELQTQWLREGRAYLVGAYDSLYEGAPGGPFHAFAYIFTYKDAAYYGSGPSLVPSAMHAVLWRAILEAKARGLRLFEVGWQGHGTTAKEKGIERFKAGFGGLDVPVYVMEVS